MSATATPTTLATGKVVQVLGNVVDVEFPADALPNINDALSVHIGGGSNAGGNGAGAHLDGGIKLSGTAMAERDLVLEVQGELGNNQVRCLGHGFDRRSRARRGRAEQRRARSRCRSAKARSGASSTCSARRSTPTSR